MVDEAAASGDFHAPAGNTPISQNWQHNEIEALKDRVAFLEGVVQGIMARLDENGIYG